MPHRCRPAAKAASSAAAPFARYSAAHERALTSMSLQSAPGKIQRADGTSARSGMYEMSCITCVFYGHANNALWTVGRGAGQRTWPTEGLEATSRTAAGSDVASSILLQRGCKSTSAHQPTQPAGAAPDVGEALYFCGRPLVVHVIVHGDRPLFQTPAACVHTERSKMHHIPAFLWWHGQARLTQGMPAA